MQLSAALRRSPQPVQWSYFAFWPTASARRRGLTLVGFYVLNARRVAPVPAPRSNRASRSSWARVAAWPPRGLFCVFDPRFVRLGARPTERAYLAQDHVVVSYNGDLRGVIEENFGKERRVRCSVANFASVGAIVDGGHLVATVPSIVASQVLRIRRHLRVAPIPFPQVPGTIDLLWPSALDGDPACRFVRDAIVRMAAVAQKSLSNKRPTGVEHGNTR